MAGICAAHILRLCNRFCCALCRRPVPVFLVRAKTGTVKGVCTLAGYAQTADGHLYAFVMLNGGLQKASTVRKWQDKVLEAICR